MRSLLLCAVAWAAAPCAGPDCARGTYRRTPSQGKLSLAEVEEDLAEHQAQGSGQQKMTFYMYRAQNDETYEVGNNNLGTLSGVMWYIHNEVVRISCPRHYNISRILRFNVTVHNPAAVAEAWPNHPQFGPYLAFDHGQCTVPNCTDNYLGKYGNYVGCQTQHDKEYPGQVYWYSLPGACPDEKFEEKSWWCNLKNPGGSCWWPSGDSYCTWHVESAGEVTLNELSGIGNYDTFCKSGHKEYDEAADAGKGTSFWDQKLDSGRNQERLARVQELFKQKYPSQPADLPTPTCEW